MMSLYKQGDTSKWINLLPIFPVIQMNRPLHSLEMISRISRWNMENKQGIYLLMEKKGGGGRNKEEEKVKKEDN